MNDLSKLTCKECGQREQPMLVFVKALKMEDGEVVQLEEGYFPYCEPCRRKLGISDELNAGRDLRAEARQAVLDALQQAKEAGKSESGRDKGISIIMREVDRWAGGSDGLMTLLGRGAPPRPSEVYEGVNDALGEVDPVDLEIEHSLALISITNQLEDRLSNWKPFVQRTYKHYRSVMGEERASKNLEGFV